ncbi:helix-turn-helix transcriptional regulator [Flavobacterium sp.]|jgi:proteasome accessory factor B|uniref:helix-turn-helix transcriptional regulator n=1 Tax=Flavobacterium sp. TaxID=239 RepID=UPI0037BF8650
MAKKEYLQRYILIVELLRRKEVSFQEIQDYLFQKDIEISQRTFQRDKEEIESLWGIEIKYNKKEGIYEIKEELSDGKFDRIAESFTLASALNQNETFSKYIFLEQRKPKGTEYFNGILHAIQNNLIITFQLNSFWSEPTQRRCVPKAIKEAQNRWYLIAYDIDRSDFRNYGLDRISNFEITSSKKLTPSININEYYKNAFGIETQGQPYKVILKLDNAQKKYLQSLPIHHSQKIVEEKENYFIIELFLHLNFDFRMEILQLGSLCEVLEPVYFRNEIIEEIKKLNKNYKV